MATVKQLHATFEKDLAAWSEAKGAVKENTDVRNAKARDYHLSLAALFAGDPTFTAYKALSQWAKADDKNANVPEEKNLDSANASMRRVRDDFAAVRGAVGEKGERLDIVLDCWRVKEEGKRAVSKQVFYDSCRVIRDGKRLGKPVAWDNMDGPQINEAARGGSDDNEKLAAQIEKLAGLAAKAKLYAVASKLNEAKLEVEAG